MRQHFKSSRNLTADVVSPTYFGKTEPSFLSALLCILGFSWSVNADPDIQTILSKGINLGTWLSHSKKGGPVTETDIQKIAVLGFTHVRLPVDKGFLREAKQDVLDEVVKWTGRHNLGLIIDLHSLPPPSLKRKRDIHKFTELWSRFARHTSLYPSYVMYELLNESRVEDADLWQKIVEGVVAAIRVHDPSRYLVVSGPGWGGVSDLSKLRPLKDPRIIYTFHSYFPMAFTHQSASWAGQGLSSLKNISYPIPPRSLDPLYERFSDRGIDTWFLDEASDGVDREMLARSLSPAIEFATKYHVPIYCGEFGAIKAAPREDRLRWTRDMVALLNENHIGWATWNDFNTFGPLLQGGQFDQGMIEALGLAVESER